MAGQHVMISQLHNSFDVPQRQAAHSLQSRKKSSTPLVQDGGSVKFVQPLVEVSDDGSLPGTSEMFKRDSSQTRVVIVPPPPRHGLSSTAREIGGGLGSSNVSKSVVSNNDETVHEFHHKNVATGACRIVVTTLCFLVGFGLLVLRAAPTSYLIIHQALYDVSWLILSSWSAG